MSVLDDVEGEDGDDGDDDDDVLAVLGYRGLHGADLLLGVLPRRQGGAQRAQVRDRDRGLRQAAVQAGAGEGQTNESTASCHVIPY